MKREGGDPFLALMKLIPEKQKDPTPSEDLSKVTVFVMYCHIIVLRMSLKAPMWDCLYCGEHFTTKEQNRIHVQQHCKEKPEIFIALRVALSIPQNLP